MTKLTYDRVETTGNNAVNASKLLVSVSDTRTIQQALLEASAGAFGGDLNFEFREITAGEAFSQQINLAIEPSSPTSTIVFVSGGTVQYYGEDYLVTGDVLSWASPLGLSDIIVEGTRLVIIYPYSTTTPVGSGDVTRVEYFSLGAPEISQKYVDLLTTPANPSAVQFFIIGGSAQKKSTDWELITDGVSDKRISWDGYALESQLADGDELMIVYTITTTNVDRAVNVQVDDVTPFVGTLAGATEVQAALDIIDAFDAEDIPVKLSTPFDGHLAGADNIQEALDLIDEFVLGGGSGTGILGSGSILLVDPNHPSAVDNTDVSTPFITIQAAIDAATPAVPTTVLVADGDYSELDITVKDNRIINLTALTSSKSALIKPVSITGNIVVGGDAITFPLVDVSGSLTVTGIQVNSIPLAPEPPVELRQANSALGYTNHLVLKDCILINPNSDYNIGAQGGGGLFGLNSLELYNTILSGTSSWGINITFDLYCKIDNSSFSKVIADFTSSGYLEITNSSFSRLETVTQNGSYYLRNNNIVNTTDEVVYCNHTSGTLDIVMENNYVLCTNPAGNWLGKNTGDVNLSRFINNTFYNSAENIPPEVSPSYENGKEILIRQYEGIDAASTGTHNLYTVPAGTKVVVTKVMFRLTTASGISGTLQCGVGVAAGEDDIITSTSLTGFNSTNEVFKIETSGNYRLAGAGEVIKLGIDTALTGTATLSVDLFGYLVV